MIFNMLRFWKQKKKAVCAFIYILDENHQYRILSVSRKDDEKDFGMPGGKLDPNESYIDALIREVKEETGLDILNYKHLLTRKDKEYIVKTYICKAIGEINHDPNEGKIQLLNLDQFLDPSNTFFLYNKKVIEKIYNVITRQDQQYFYESRIGQNAKT